MGVAKPGRIIEGTLKIKAPINPCCWVVANEEIIKTTPTPESKNDIIPLYSVTRLPNNGTLNQLLFRLGLKHARVSICARVKVVQIK